MKTSYKSDALEIGRSLIQKALRRGDLEISKLATLWLMQSGDSEWVRNRLAVLTFEECWTYGSVVSFEKDETMVIQHILTLASTVKNRNAAGLGYLAYRLSESDESVLSDNESDTDLRIIANAIQTPALFWEEIRNLKVNNQQRVLVEHAYDSFEKAEQPWDKAFTQAAAHLAATNEIPETVYAKSSSEKDFPLWISIDKHTRLGTLAIKEAAHQINFDSEKALWLAFYFEGVKCNEMAFSPWWEREKIWRMEQLGLTFDEAHETWERMKPHLVELLKPETARLRERLLQVS